MHRYLFSPLWRRQCFLSRMFVILVALMQLLPRYVLIWVCLVCTAFVTHGLIEAPTIFKRALEEVLATDVNLPEFSRAKQRALGMTGFRGSFADRIVQSYRQWLFGRPDGYNQSVQRYIRSMQPDCFRSLITRQFSGLPSSVAIYIGSGSQ